MVLIKDGIVCKKCNFDIYKLYNYLYSRDFRYLVDIMNDRKIDELTVKQYINKYEKFPEDIDIIFINSLIHISIIYRIWYKTF